MEPHGRVLRGFIYLRTGFGPRQRQPSAKAGGPAIKAGKPALTAVNDAQGELLRGRYSRGQYHFSRAHPFFWAAFVYVGD